MNDNQNHDEINNVPVSGVEPSVVDNTQPNSSEMDLGDKTIAAVENFINTTDTASEYTAQDKKKNKTFALLCYLPLVVFYIIFTGKYKNSKYLSFHANQGLNVTLFYIAAFAIASLLKILFKRDSYIRNDVPGWVGFICYVLYCCAFLLTLFGIINTTNESSKEMPLIGKYRILK
ncbi:MAG: hypothetical protein IKR57_06650 [Bacilli bacterium]|nr:hypothetical protein [Bacilli bacterium]